MKQKLKNISMNKSFLPTLNLFLWLALAFLLPWQTKLILRPAPSNYWEISLFAAMAICFALLAVFFISNFKAFKKIVLPKILIVSFSLFLVAMIASVFLASDPLLSIYRYLWLLLFLISLSTFKYIKKEWQVYVLLTLLVSLLFQAGIGIGQFLNQKSFANTFLGMSFHDLSQAGVTVIETASGRYLRAYGPLDHPNVFGGFMALAAIVSAYLYIRLDNKYYRYFSVFAYSIFNLALFCSFSRAAFLALFLGMIFLFFENRKKILPSLSLISISLILISLFIFQYQELIFSRLETTNRLEKISINERGVYNRQAWKSFTKNPILGQGLSNSTLALYKADQVNHSEQVIWAYQPAHNYWLLLLTEGGIILFTAFLLFYIFAYQKSRSYRLLGLFICFFILGLFDHWLFSLSLASVLPLFWLVFI